MGERLRIALMGYGAWGAHHARAIARSGVAELAAICTRGGEPPEPTPEDGVLTLAVSLAALESLARGGTPVAVGSARRMPRP